MAVQKGSIVKWLGAVVLILAVPNILFWLLSPRLYMIRGIFVLEYFLLACLYPYISRKIFVVLWVLLTLYDLIVSTTSIFFMDLFEIFHALKEPPDVPFTSMLIWAGLLLLLVTITALLLRFMFRYNEKARFLHPRFILPLLLFVLVVDLLNGQGLIRHRSLRIIPLKQNIVSIPTWSFVKSVQRSFKKQQPANNKEGYIGSVAHAAFDSTTEKKQLLVLIESWGLLQNKELHREVLKPVYDMAQQLNYQMKEGTTRYKYLTQAGEMREITGYIVRHYQADDEFSQKYSLFIKKQQQGYRVIGVHGFSSAFYNRTNIWPSLGVQEMYFANKLKEQSLAECGDRFFKGICDTAIATWILNYAKKQPERKEFFYWLTLNTHLPIEERDDEKYRSFAAKWLQQGIPDDVLQLAYEQLLFFEDLAKKLSGPLAPKMHVLLVGDHAPPYVDPRLRRMYDDKLVPYVELIPARN